MFEEDIFGEDSVTLVLRNSEYVIQKFDRKSKVVTFYRLKAILAGREMPCFFSKKDDRRPKKGTAPKPARRAGCRADVPAAG